MSVEVYFWAAVAFFVTMLLFIIFALYNIENELREISKAISDKVFAVDFELRDIATSLSILALRPKKNKDKDKSRETEQ